MDDTERLKQLNTQAVTAYQKHYYEVAKAMFEELGNCDEYFKKSPALAKHSNILLVKGVQKGGKLEIESFLVPFNHSELNDYTFLNHIGSGAFGVVRQYAAQDSSEVAIKQICFQLPNPALPIDPSSIYPIVEMGTAYSEFITALALKHDRLVECDSQWCAPILNQDDIWCQATRSIYEKQLESNQYVSFTTTGDPLAIPPPWVAIYLKMKKYKTSLASLMQDINFFQPSARLKIVKQVVEGVEYIHSEKWNHNDLKSDNILLDDNNNAFIADFGLSSRRLQQVAGLIPDRQSNAENTIDQAYLGALLRSFFPRNDNQNNAALETLGPIIDNLISESPMTATDLLGKINAITEDELKKFDGQTNCSFM